MCSSHMYREVYVYITYMYVLYINSSPRSHNVLAYVGHTHIHNVKVKGIVRENLNKVTERGERLDDLGEKAGT